MLNKLKERYPALKKERLLLLGAIGAAMLVIGNLVGGEAKNDYEEKAVEKINIEPDAAGRREEQALENKLQLILSQVKGAGKVDISVSLNGSSVKKYEKNIVRETRVTEEKGAQGQVKTTNEIKENSQVMTNRERGEEKPVIATEERPVVRGVIIVADGAGDSTVKENLLRAAEAGLSVSPNKITILPRGR
jgi:stage III sporulation protein AG